MSKNLNGSKNVGYFIMQSWTQAASAFLPKKLQLQLLVAVNAWVQALKVFFSAWSPLVLAYVGVHSLTPAFFHKRNFLSLDVSLLLVWAGVLAITTVVVLFASFLSMRPSVSLKDYAYVWSYTKKYLVGFSALLLFWLFLNSAVATIAYIPLLADSINILFSPFFVCTTFFYLDASAGILTAMKRGIKMVLLTLPFWLGAYCIFTFMLVGVHTFLIDFIFSNFFLRIVLKEVTFILWYLFYICFVHVFYSKKAHDNYSLYFD